LGRNGEEGRDYFEISLFGPIFGKGSKSLQCLNLSRHLGESEGAGKCIKKIASYNIKILA
jgi:hypothetical protein